MKIKKLTQTAKELLQQHDLSRWRCALKSNTGSLIGGCKYSSRLIFINRFYAEHNREEYVIDTLLHELAHALTPGNGHNKVWKKVALELGCNPKLDWEKITIQPGKYQAQCPTCELIFHKYRKPKYVRGYYCPKCGKEHGQLSFRGGHEQ